MDGTTVANHALSAAQMAQVERLPGLVDATVAKGDVTIYQFYDLNCPYCRQAAADIGKLIAADSALRLVFVPYPVLSVQSIEASRVELAVRELDPKRFFEFHRKVYAGRGVIDGARAHQRDGRHGPRPRQDPRDRQQARHHRHHEDSRPRRRRAEADGHAGLT